jgi:serine protease AprX
MKHRVNIFSIFVVLLLFLQFLSPAATASAAETPARVQALLAEIARQSPVTPVKVIIQKQTSGGRLQAQVEQAGGEIVADLSIINAFAAEMPARAAVELSKDPAVRWVSLDAPVVSTACSQCIDTTKLLNTYIGTIKADKVWNTSPYVQGQGIGVAVVDSGVNPNGDFYTATGVNRQVANVRFNTDYNQTPYDGYGHGTHVSSIIGGDGSDSSFKYIGVAPMANIINVKVSNDDGSARMQDVILGLQWFLQKKSAYNIRVVNISLNSSVAESYNTSPLNAAVEVLWFNGIVVVVSAGNSGYGELYPPANDPFVITVGATDDEGTSNITDDVVATFSAYGSDETGATKPDLVAPGRNIVAHLLNTNMGIALAHPANKLPSQYFRMSGTSMAAPMVSGAVALLLKDEPLLNPDQVKYRLMTTANRDWAGYDPAKAGAGCVDIYAAVTGATTESANTGILASNLLTTGSEPITWNSVGWNSVGWNSVGWNSVGWNSVGWNSVGWNSVGWNSVGWNSDYWE